MSTFKLKKRKIVFLSICKSLLLLCLYASSVSTALADHQGSSHPMPPTNLAVDNNVQPDECLNPDPNWIFCSSFEEGNKDIWDDYDGNPDSTNLLMQDPGPQNLTGNHVMRIRIPAGTGGADLVKELPGTHDTVYARWYIKWENGYNFNALNHSGGLHAGSRNHLGSSGNRPAGDDWFRITIEPTVDLPHVLNGYAYYRGMYMDCSDPNGACWGDHLPCMIDEGQNYCTKPKDRETTVPPTLQNDAWYCVEMMINSGTPVADEANADGEFNFWVNGQEIGPMTNMWFRTAAQVTPSILWLRLYHHGEHSIQGIMYDNVVVSTNRIGCL